MFRNICPEEEGLIRETALMEQEIFPDPWSSREIASTVAQKQTFCMAALENEEVQGYFFCYYVLDECEIARIAVRASCRRSGVGRRLLSEMEEKCSSLGIRRIMLEVRESNMPAISFYRKNGFVTEGRRRGYYPGSPPEDAVLMGKELPAVPTGTEPLADV